MTTTVQILEQGPRNLVLNVLCTAAPDAAFLLVDVSTLSPPCDEVRLDCVNYDAAVGTVATLLWDATTDVPFLTLSEGNGHTRKFSKVGGITNNAGAGVTGDVLLTTAGVSATAPISMVLHFVKKYN